MNTQKTLIGKTSRRFNELDPENLHRYSMGHYEKSNGGGFFTFWLFSPFFRGPRFFGTNALHSDPSNSKINEKIKKPNSSDFALWPIEHLCKNSGSNSSKRREGFRVCAMNLAVPRWNCKLLDLKYENGVLGPSLPRTWRFNHLLIDFHHEISWGPSSGYVATARFGKKWKKNIVVPVFWSQNGDYLVKRLGSCWTEKR